jgi:hypothetical protein
MRIVRLGILVALCVVAACSKSDKETKEKDSALADFAGKTIALDSSAVLIPLLEARGFQLVGTKRMPAQLSAHRGTAAIYRSADGTRGGVLYMQRSNNSSEGITWHWYFADGAPDSIQAVEINGDGLWDVRVFMAGGSTRDFIQGESFSLLAEREARFAMNGAASAGDAWKAFDGDTATAWQAPSRDAYIDVPLPLGVPKGEIAVRVASGNHAHKLQVYAGDKKIQEVELQRTNAVQSAQLDDAAKDAPAIRIVVEGPDEMVAISELEIR